MTEIKKNTLLKRMWKGRTGYLFLLPLMIGVICFAYYPPILAIIKSFTDWSSASSGTVIGFGNYKELFHDQVFLDSIPTMLILSIPSLIISIFVPLVMAELIYHVACGKMKSLYRVLVLLPIIAPGVIGTYIWTFIYQQDGGLLNGLLNAVGIHSEINWLNDSRYVLFSMIFMGFPWVGGTNVLIYMSGLMDISTEVIEAARLDGAGTMRIIRSIHMPALVGQIRYFAVFGIIGAFQNYGMQVILSNSGKVDPDITNSAIMVPGYYMYQQAFKHGRMGYACAIGTLLFAFVGLLTLLTFKVFKAKRLDLDE